ncbi:MAG: dihydropteroate synthase [Gemmatimonadetes bacterium]|nr:dihydropteroate synthase [Gemmatimonadota bacterium]
MPIACTARTTPYRAPRRRCGPSPAPVAPAPRGRARQRAGVAQGQAVALADDYEGILEVAREQAESGAHVLDVCVALTERGDEAAQMATVTKLLSMSVETPIMVDSTEGERDPRRRWNTSRGARSSTPSTRRTGARASTPWSPWRSRTAPHSSRSPSMKSGWPRRASGSSRWRARSTTSSSASTRCSRRISSSTRSPSPSPPVTPSGSIRRTRRSRGFASSSGSCRES